IDYGEDVGTVTLTVFRERAAEPVYDPEEPRAVRDARVVGSAKLPDKPPASFGLLKQRLLEGASEGSDTRGVIGGGGKEEAPVRVAEFKPDPTPVMSVTLIYY